MRPHPLLLPLTVALFVGLAPASVSSQSWLDVAKEAARTIEKKSKSAPAEQQPEPASREAAPSEAAAPAATGDVGGQPDLQAVKSDFVPGEKTLFYDDFTDMAGDEPPPHWKVRGGVAELRTGGSIRQLTLTNGAIVLSPNLRSLPQNFTMEAELTLAKLSYNGGRVNWTFLDAGEQAVLDLTLFAQDSNEGVRIETELRLGSPGGDVETLGSAKPAVDWRKPIQQALWLQDGRIRLYVNGARIVDVNQVSVDMSRVRSVEFTQDMNNSPEAIVGLRRVRFAESTPDFSKVIAASGRYVTHGILFDTGSDRIRPESAGVIRSVARGLEANPGLALLIEGHTDSTGDAAQNNELSKRRAEAVRSVLVSQFKIDAVRLRTAGLGATKPIDTNDTPQGRAQNRRVEFVKQ